MSSTDHDSFGSGPAGAQASGPVPPGTKVRVTAPTAIRSPVVGLFVGIDQDTLRIERAGATMAIPQRSVTRLETGRGRHSNLANGALLGLLIGTVVGAALAPSDLEDATAVYAAVGAGGGLVTGSVVGLAITSERWQVVPFQSHAAAGPVLLRVAIAF